MNEDKTFTINLSQQQLENIITGKKDLCESLGEFPGIIGETLKDLCVKTTAKARQIQDDARRMRNAVIIWGLIVIILLIMIFIVLCRKK